MVSIISIGILGWRHIVSRKSRKRPQQLDIAHLLSAGVLVRICPRELIDDVLEKQGKKEQRRRLLPAPAVVYYIMAQALWRDAPLEEVLRIICEGLRWLGDKTVQSMSACKSAISQARSRLGPEVMRQLADRVLKPVSPPKAIGAWYRGLRVMALDGSCLDVPDEKANVEYFGYPSSSRGETAFPQLRTLALVECGSHVVCGAEIGPYRTSEQEMAVRLIPAKLTEEMLLLADRNFYGFKLWSAACDSRGKLLWRVRSSLKLKVERRLSDGSYLSTVYAGADRARRHGLPVRVVEYSLEGEPEDGQIIYRLVTNILDPEQGPGKELAALYHERWEVENAFGEIKTHLYGNNLTMRSKKPDLIQQELWGLYLAHFAIRQLMAEAAWQTNQDPDELSFTAAVRIVKRRLPQMGSLPPSGD